MPGRVAIFLSCKTSFIVSDNGLVSGKAVDVTSENNRHSKVHYFDFLVSCLYTFNPLSLSLKWVMTLVETTYKEKHGERKVLQNYQHDKGKWVRKETIYFCF